MWEREREKESNEMNIVEGTGFCEEGIGVLSVFVG